MKSFTSAIIVLTTLLSITSASPTARLNARTKPSEVKVVLKGATPEAQYYAYVKFGETYYTG
jgi:hypothetical protein